MHNRAGYQLSDIDGRSIVRLRVRPQKANSAADALHLPRQAMQSLPGDPASHWLGPDQWLLTSERKSAAEIIATIDSTLAGQLYAANDLSCALACINLSGPHARTVLAMGCGIDMHPDAFAPGQCVRTNFAQLPLLIIASQDAGFDLYVDRGYAEYLHQWLKAAGEDPMTQLAPTHEA